MSLLLSDSLVGVLDEKELLDEEEPCGVIRIGGDDYEVDAFLSDGKVIRVHVAATVATALRFLAAMPTVTGELILGDKAYVAKGKVLQVGWERLAHGDRLVISMNVRDK